MDKVKKYLLENKEALDTDVPQDVSWTILAGRIRQLRAEKQRSVRRLVISGLAAGFLLAVAGVGLWRSNTPQLKPAGPANAPATTIPQAEAVSRSYSPLILRELTNLRQTAFYGPDTSGFKSFSLQWKALEENEKAIEKNMASVGFNEQLLDQLTNNYQSKIQLLKQFSHEINKVKGYLPPADTLIKTPSLSLLGL
jgi:hypothetical protein